MKIIMISILLLLAPLSLNYSGMCITKFRWISDDDKISIVFNKLNSLKTTMIEIPENSGNHVRVKRIPYESTEMFLIENPQCCQIGPPIKTREGIFPDFTFYQKLWGFGGSQINVTYKEYIEGYGKVDKSQIVSRIYKLTNCGNVLSN